MRVTFTALARALPPASNIARPLCTRSGRVADFIKTRPTSPFCQETSSERGFLATLEEADDIANRSDWRGAIKLWKEVLSTDPSNTQALTNTRRFQKLIDDGHSPESGF